MLSKAGQPPGTQPLELLGRESRFLVQRLRLWTPARYAARIPGTDLRRADVVHHLVQSFADAAGAYDSMPPRLVPRLPVDLVLADQLAVTSDDLVRSGPPDADARLLTAHLLAHRAELLDDEVPAGLAVALGWEDVLAAGRAACDLGTGAPSLGPGRPTAGHRGGTSRRRGCGD